MYGQKWDNKKPTYFGATPIVQKEVIVTPTGGRAASIGNIICCTRSLSFPEKTAKDKGLRGAAGRYPQSYFLQTVPDPSEAYVAPDAAGPPL
jgi:hypothetical protein